MRLWPALALAAGLIAMPAAHSSVFIGTDAGAPRLAVDAAGSAVIAFTSGGAKQSITVPAKGQLFHGGSVARDVSRPAPGVRVPLAVVVRRGPGGLLYALQRWQQEPGGPVELHFARWKGALPTIRLVVEGGRLTGTATFQGRPIAGTTTTLEGKRIKIYVYLDCFRCPGSSGWKKLIGVAPKADGTFAVFLRPEWMGRRYRAKVEGPNIGTTYAPDAQTEIAAP